MRVLAKKLAVAAALVEIDPVVREVSVEPNWLELATSHRARLIGVLI